MNLTLNQEQIETILHHKPPYLMVSEVLELNQKEITVVKIHNGDEAHIKGHFPHAPIVPGAMLQELCTQGAGILLTKFYSPVENYHSDITKGYALGVLNKVNYAKYMDVVFPTKPITAKISLIESQDHLYKFLAKVFQADKIKAKLSFNLINTSDKILFEDQSPIYH